MGRCRIDDASNSTNTLAICRPDEVKGESKYYKLEIA